MSADEPPMTAPAIAILAADARNAPDAAALDGSFTIAERLLLSATPDAITWQAMPVPPYRKDYHELDRADSDRGGASAPLPAEYLGSADSAAFLAYAAGKPCGLLLLSTGWNGLAVIDDILVDAGARRLGVGSALLAHAEAWARGRGLPGIMLETQDSNVPACRLYARHGYQLRGFDRSLYATHPGTAHETALFWYLLFNDRTLRN
ncbi:hypothetical protein ASD15_19230 [Massilia sp. Root351]|jgi:ribosomal protein S18 acetylase RimI-like enzyme|uniref:GNAT family N-acetyltransferase n=1 Tax=Massilia sp. Root351 TaxID=1736522 RepID=UPI00070E5114|nr:GNAT family N-acetyltransferase [Massilia sp. Root351]KQV79460.1 hypothetical protein ASD15_19230 [Massilia sp. Root351]